METEEMLGKLRGVRRRIMNSEIKAKTKTKSEGDEPDPRHW
jgi:hypothetical protein